MTNTPRLWRTLKVAQDAGDVEAMQRGMHLLLGAAARNDRSGKWGQLTTDDVRRTRSKLRKDGSERSCGQDLFDALWPHIDANGRAAFHRPAAGTTPAITPKAKALPLKKGQESKGVQAIQRALWRALPDAENARNGVYGDGTARDLIRFRKRYRVNPSDGGNTVGGEMYRALSRWFDQTAINLVNDWKPPTPPPKPPTMNALRAKIIHELDWAYQNRGRYKYAQVRPMPTSLHGPPTLHTDCSGYATLGHRDGGAPNPNSRTGRYDGYGYTGTLAAACSEVAKPLAADFAMYGARPNFHHVAICDGRGGVYSFGHDPIEHYSSAQYRSDFACYLRSPHL